ncbi:uncharacterized protein BP01DRAFT_359504 [Aspergillus saccharolyticus JOP 1030-1]|uniref:Uncharacterized protein n=1 Tax=Aspergillus saccharolyticus JOP 1030-1 TaxID=1450539 RepID=A0A318Z5P0_9EURO|nr:hypothetical protein BP01DRAFT_359504 [Aspergillus saccharolyticus JOP 1030-1]PYH42419.1 hypothetical protein BP01DRAFT_359504 [Aspergillus saccharolyticus JOP 1030-1]
MAGLHPVSLLVFASSVACCALGAFASYADYADQHGKRSRYKGHRRARSRPRHANARQHGA